MALLVIGFAIILEIIEFLVIHKIISKENLSAVNHKLSTDRRDSLLFT